MVLARPLAVRYISLREIGRSGNPASDINGKPSCMYTNEKTRIVAAAKDMCIQSKHVYQSVL